MRVANKGTFVDQSAACAARLRTASQIIPVSGLVGRSTPQEFAYAFEARACPVVVPSDGGQALAEQFNPPLEPLQRLAHRLTPWRRPRGGHGVHDTHRLPTLRLGKIRMGKAGPEGSEGACGKAARLGARRAPDRPRRLDFLDSAHGGERVLKSAQSHKAPAASTMPCPVCRRAARIIGGWLTCGGCLKSWPLCISCAEPGPTIDRECEKCRRSKRSTPDVF